MRPGVVAAVAVALAAVFGVIGEFRMPLNGDAAYHVDAARRMLDGATLYRDINDLNPPFIFWGSVPAAVAGETGATRIVAFRMMVIVVALMALLMAWRSTGGALPTRTAFVLMALGLPVGYFGQREHLLFLLLFPYVALAAQRAEGGSAGRAQAILAGLVAALAISLKPTAAVVPTLIGLYLVASRRTWRVLFVPEHLAIVTGLALALAAIVAFVPQYFEVVRQIQAPYREFNRQPLGALLARDVHMWAVWLALGCLGLLGWTHRQARRVRVLGLATAGLFVSAVFQAKGFGYHYFPAVGYAVIVLAELLAGPPRDSAKSAMLRRACAAIALIPIVYLFGAVAWRRTQGVFTRTRADQIAVARLAGDRPVRIAVLSARIADAFPMVLEQGYRFVLRYPLFWAATLPPGEPGTAAIRRQYGDDLQRNRPDLVVVRAPDPRERHTGDPDVNYLDYLCTDAAARRALSHYRLADRAGGFDLYRLDANGPQACASL